MLIEIHMLKNYPPVNLNRDDGGAPKSCFFGGVQRGRISSQCLKRSWRTSETFRSLGSFGIRTRSMPAIVGERLTAMGVAPEFVEEAEKKLTGISYVYIEHAVIEQEDSSITAFQKDARIPIPISAVTCLMLGPGTKITHAAIKATTENGCMIVWCGENGIRFYASGMGETRSAVNLLRQAELCVNPETRLEVAKRMYIRRFGSISSPDYSLQQLRGMEGIRVREAYKLASKTTGIPWSARTYKKDDWNAQDPINLALSQANALLYSVCQAAIVSLGFSTGLGFIHTGKQLSFVYDIVDLYKAEITIPAAFQSARYPGSDLSAAVRKNCRTYFQQAHLLKRIPDDIEWIFDLPGSEQRESPPVGNLWDPEGEIPGGVNHYGE